MISFLAHAIAGNVGSAGSATTSGVDTSGATLLVAYISYLQPAGASTVSDSKSNSWNIFSPQTTTSTLKGALAYCVNPIVGTSHTFTVSGGGASSVPAIAMMAFGKTVVPASFDQFQGAKLTVNGTTLQPGAIAPSFDGSVIAIGCTMDSTGSMSIDSGFTIADQFALSGGNHFALGFAYLIQSVAASINPTWSFTSQQAATTQADWNPGAAGLLPILGAG